LYYIIYARKSTRWIERTNQCVETLLDDAYEDKVVNNEKNPQADPISFHDLRGYVALDFRARRVGRFGIRRSG